MLITLFTSYKLKNFMLLPWTFNGISWLWEKDVTTPIPFFHLSTAPDLSSDYDQRPPWLWHLFFQPQTRRLASFHLSAFTQILCPQSDPLISSLQDESGWSLHTPLPLCCYFPSVPTLLPSQHSSRWLFLCFLGFHLSSHQHRSSLRIRIISVLFFTVEGFSLLPKSYNFKITSCSLLF